MNRCWVKDLGYKSWEGDWERKPFQISKVKKTSLPSERNGCSRCCFVRNINYIITLYKATNLLQIDREKIFKNMFALIFEEVWRKFDEFWRYMKFIPYILSHQSQITIFNFTFIRLLVFRIFLHKNTKMGKPCQPQQVYLKM